MAARKPTKKAASTGSPTLDALTAAKKFKAPKDYKPLSTKEKLGMVATIVGPGKVIKGAKVATKAAKTITATKKIKNVAKTTKQFDKEMTALGRAAGWTKGPGNKQATKNIRYEISRTKGNVPIRSRNKAETELAQFKMGKIGGKKIQVVDTKKNNEYISKQLDKHVDKELQRLIEGRKNQSWKMRGR